MKKKMIVVDIDGVLAKFDELFDSYIKRILPHVDTPKKEEVHLRDRYGIDDDAIDMVFNKFVGDGMFQFCKPLPGIQKINYLHDPVIITVRPKEAAEDTYLWLAGNNLHYKKAIFTKDKSKYAKDTAVIFEDRGDYILPFAEAGVKCYLFDHPYNKDVKHKNITRIKGWNDVKTSDINKLCR